MSEKGRRAFRVSVDYPSIGTALKAMRLGRKLSRAQLAKAAGVSVSTIARAESPAANPLVPNLDKILRAMGFMLTLEPR